MRKKLSIVISVFIIATSITPVFAANINIDNQNVLFTEESGQPFIDQANRTQVPFRQAMEAFGCVVTWDESTKTAIAEKNGVIVQVPIGAYYIFRNGQQIPNDTTALIKDNKTYLPIKSVLQAFGASVNWDGATQTVSVVTDGQKNMTIHFINVGQADSIFIDMGTYEILVDGGNRSEGNLVVDYIKPYVDGNLDLIVATHSHVDHMGGLYNVISAFDVSEIIYSDEKPDTTVFNDFFKAASEEANCTFIGDSDQSFDLGNGAQFKILEMGDGYADVNENSVVSMVDYNDVEVLLMGDLDMAVEKSNLGRFEDIDVLKVGHHGSRTASSQAFLDVVKPEVSIISAGLDNDFLLPGSEAIDRLLSMNSLVYGTFRSGNIIMTTDGSGYNFNTDIQLSLSDAGAHTTPGNVAAYGSVIEKEAAYVGNLSTMKFHTLNCSAGEKISDRYAVYFKSRADAIDAGFTSCKICNP